MIDSMRSLPISLSFLSSLTRHCWSAVKNPRLVRSASSCLYFAWSSWSCLNSGFSAARRSISGSISAIGTSSFGEVAAVWPPYTPALFSLSRLPVPQEVGRRRLELHGDAGAFGEAQFLDATLRHQG